MSLVARAAPGGPEFDSQDATKQRSDLRHCRGVGTLSSHSICRGLILEGAMRVGL